MVVILGLLIGGSLLGKSTHAANVNNFYFSDFTADYYLSKDSEGISHLKVIESVTAEFPDYNQNKGICRQIPFTNQDKKNVTLKSLTRSNLKLTRNGIPEPIYSIEKENDYYNVCTGTEEYVLGTQTYVFEYEFEKVVTEFTDIKYDDDLEPIKSSYQELYWDTNGNGASQRFDSVTARLHFSNGSSNPYAGKSWCYVGSYGAKGQERCKITEIDDGVEFAAKNLKAYENLTFVAELKPGSFVVPGPVEDYTYLYLLGIIIIICIICIIVAIRRSADTRKKARRYKELFVKPEYQPSKDYGLTEMAEVYLGDKKDVEVAMLLEMIVQRKIELIKEDKKKWSFTVKQEVYNEYADLLSIVNGGIKPEVGDTVKVEKHTPTTTLVSLGSSLKKAILEQTKQDGLVEDKYTTGASHKRGFANNFALILAYGFFVMMFVFFAFGLLDEGIGLNSTYGKIMVFEEEFFPAAFQAIMITIIICVIVINKTAQFKYITDKGLEASNYMEGLKLYIEMAEADRIKLLQSVEGADVSAEGIVKLYEKLLPYAAVFGLEESWMNEMKEYCKVAEIEEPDYLITGLAVSEISRSLHSAATYASTSTTMGSSGGSSSSGFSGGGGGGFSGGGGGGGGFSGR